MKNGSEQRVSPMDATQDHIIEEVRPLAGWQEKYAYLIRLGDELEQMPEESRSQDNLLAGCQSTVWPSSTDACGSGAPRTPASRAASSRFCCAS